MKEQASCYKNQAFLSFANWKFHKIGAFFRGLHGLDLEELGIPADTALMAEYAKLTGLSGKKAVVLLTVLCRKHFTFFNQSRGVIVPFSNN